MCVNSWMTGCTLQVCEQLDGMMTVMMYLTSLWTVGWHDVSALQVCEQLDGMMYRIQVCEQLDDMMYPASVWTVGWHDVYLTTYKCLNSWMTWCTLQVCEQLWMADGHVLVRLMKRSLRRAAVIFIPTTAAVASAPGTGSATMTGLLAVSWAVNVVLSSV